MLGGFTRERVGGLFYTKFGRRGMENTKRTMSHRASRMLYVGNLPGDICKREVEDLFYKYGHIVEIDLKIPPRPPGYAFVEFEDYRDAEDAIRGRDGYDFDGHRLCVEYAHGGRGSSSVDRYSSYRGSILVTGLPSSASWQDLKDHMRRAGDVCFSQVFRDRDGMRGIVDYTSYDDMRYAIRKLDDSLFRNQFDRAYIRVGKEGFLNSLETLFPRLQLFVCYWQNSVQDSHLVLKAAAQYALAIRLLWNVIQDVATQGVTVIQEAEVPVAAIAIVAGVEATLQGSNILMGLNIDLVRGLFHHSPVLSHLLALCQDPAFGGDLELRVRGLVGYGAQITATHLVVEISIDIQISATIASSSYLCKHEAVYDLPSRIMFMELVSFSLLVRNGYDLVEAELVRLRSLSREYV
ncbi:hypothetical protein RHGRI_021432 [Rhododendron griersonianum]|uniref:RRM domain-containing protein n=1 Tax=Rhododendron griersonianum TaxID=479676 RepID=A0AAV6JNB7_9ERIC|nr:hypothetical protein RHGRI_021432 [Rhododendron griersonianum]